MSSIIVVGSNPSTAAHTTSAFDASTKSGATLRSWFDQADFGVATYLNVSNIVTPKNRPLTKQEIRSAIPALQARLSWYQGMCSVDIKLVAVGKTAAAALTLLRIPFFELPHPSGLNRQLNDPKYIEEKIKGLKLYLNPSKIESTD